jgi:hypothetical protein
MECGPAGETEEQQLERIRNTIKVREINNTLRKLKREAASFLNDKDRILIQDYLKNMKTYLKLDIENFQLMIEMNRKRQEELALREEKIVLNVKNVTDKDLKLA